MLSLFSGNAINIFALQTVSCLSMICASLGLERHLYTFTFTWLSSPTFFSEKLSLNTNAGVIGLHYISAGYSTSISINRMSNITQVFPNERYMATMNRAVIASGLDQVLSGTGPFTVFVPSDLAFGKLESNAFASLFKPENKVMLTDLLNHHIVSGKYEFKDLKDGTKLKTLDGKEITVQINAGFVSINGATIQNRDVPTTNGVIHSLDKILRD